MFKKAMVVLCAVICVAAIGSSVSAQECTLEGKWEINAAAAWVDVADVTLTLVGGNVGYYFSGGLEGQLGLFYANVDAFGESGDGWALAPALVYNFYGKQPSNILPYVGLGFYYFDADIADDSETGFQYFAGAKFFPGGTYANTNRAFFIEYRGLQDVADENVNTIMLGITNIF